MNISTGFIDCSKSDWSFSELIHANWEEALGFYFAKISNIP